MFWHNLRIHNFGPAVLLVLYLFTSNLCYVESKANDDDPTSVQKSTRSSTFLRAPTSRKLQSDSSKSDDHNDEKHQQIPDAPSDDDDDEADEKNEVCIILKFF